MKSISSYIPRNSQTQIVSNWS